MNAPTQRQRLAAILAADAAGFSRLMAADEPGTMATLDAARGAFRSHIEQRQGRVVDMAGDSVLAVFDSAAGAVGAALAVHAELALQQAGSAPAQRMAFRIGVHLGDVIEKSDGTVYGDGVNTAARLQSLAEPGGVNASDAVQCAVRDRVAAVFDDLGEQQFKNLPKPVRVYRVRALAAAPPAAPDAAPSERPDVPAIVVLPFVNMSGDAEQEFFADGITEDIITELSRFRDLFVISRNSSFKFKGQAVDVRRVACDLRVQYVVEGSVRKVGNRVRITVQLIDAEADHHVWAERYDRDLQDIFAIQDEVTSAIVAVLPRRVEAAARERVAREKPDNLAAYECVLTAKVLHHRSNRPDNLAAQRLLERALALAPGYAHAHAWKACVLGQTWVHGWCADRQQTQDIIFGELQTALALGDNDSDTHRILAAVHLLQHDFERSLHHQRRALALNPNDDLIVVQQGEILTWLGEPEQGIDWVQKAMRLNPYHPERFWGHLGRAYFGARRYVEAAAAFERIASADAGHHAFLAACHSQTGDAAAAERAVKAVLAAAPEFSVASYLATLHYRHEGDRDHYRQRLLEAGLPA